jgi:RNA polymerase sigma-70 factor (ECF subfamily)
MEDSRNPSEGPGSAYPLTQWTVILNAASGDSHEAEVALERLCALYRQPIVNWFGRHADKQEAEDLAHGFLAYVLDRRLLARLTKGQGRFRFFLAACMRRFLADERAKAQALKRGGGVATFPLGDEEPDGHEQPDADERLDRDLALAIHRRVMDRLAPPPELLPYLFSKDPATGWDEVALSLNTTPAALRQRIHRLRRAHWEEFGKEVAQMVHPADRAEETRYLYEILFRNLADDG